MVKCNMRVTSGTLASVCPIQDVLLIQGWGGGGGGDKETVVLRRWGCQTKNIRILN